MRYTYRELQNVVARQIELGTLPSSSKIETGFTGDKKGRRYFLAQPSGRDVYLGQGPTMAVNTVFAMAANAANVADEKSRMKYIHLASGKQVFGFK